MIFCLQGAWPWIHECGEAAAPVPEQHPLPAPHTETQVHCQAHIIIMSWCLNSIDNFLLKRDMMIIASLPLFPWQYP